MPRASSRISQRVGAQVLYVGAALQLVIGDGERPWWDAIVVVQYPSVQAFLEMVGDPGTRSCTPIGRRR